MNKKGFAPIVIVLIITFLAIGGITGYVLIKNANKPIACTTDAKLCPDGSSVGRLPPNCEFAECPIITTATKETTTTISSSVKSSEYCLDWDLFSDNAYKDGQIHEEIKRIQEKLGVEPVGGHYGPKTQAAVEAFNRRYKLYPNIFCCAPDPRYKDVNRGTIAKFNELYCNKSLYQISIFINHASSSECPQEICPMSVLIGGYNSINRESIGNSKVLQAPYSSNILILGNLEGCKISKVYVNNQLAAYYQNPQDPTEQYAQVEEQRYISMNDKDFTFVYSPVAEATFFSIIKVTQDYNVQIETIGCKQGAD